MKVLFVHENTLGHGSYLPRFVNWFAAHPELGIEPELFNATPLPSELARKADYTVRGLRRFGLDNHFARWREVVSAHVRSQVMPRAKDFDALVINTQSVGLDLVDCGKPLFVACDATFRQLSEGRWFSEVPLGPLGSALISGLIQKEKSLFEAASKILPWSNKAAESVVTDYGIEHTRISILPPSLEIPPPRKRVENSIPRGLFIGGDFKRKGGDVLLECFERHFSGKIELDILTQSEIAAIPGVRVSRDIRAGSAEWACAWDSADFFVFPSRLETFGIVLVEAMAFGTPIISSRAGAAEEILADGAAGLLLDQVDVESLRRSIETILTDQVAAQARVSFGLNRAMAEYDLARNSRRLAELLKS